MLDWGKFGEHLEGPIPKNVMKVLQLSIEQGWDPTPITLVARMSREGCYPCYITWELNLQTWRWNLRGARVGHVRPGFSGRLTGKDFELYLQKPEVIEAEEPKKSPWGK